MKAPSRIETERLTLLRPEGRDAAEIFRRYAADPDVTRFVSWPRHSSVEDTNAFLSFSASEWKKWPAGPYLIRSRTDQRLLGGTGLAFESAREAMTGYVLAKDSWGMGYATEALMAIVRLGQEIGLERLSAFCHPDHRASRRVLEKCGFEHDGKWSGQAEFPNLAQGSPVPVVRYERVLRGSSHEPAS